MNSCRYYFRITILTLLTISVIGITAYTQFKTSRVIKGKKSITAIKKQTSSIAGIQQGPQSIQSLPLKRIIFYSNGVAYFERRGMVSGNVEINLPFKQSQVDDILKSLVVLDMGKGKIGAVSYNSSSPPSARLAEIPFEIDAETENDKDGFAQVLSQFQGAKAMLTVSYSGTGAPRTITGSILTVGKRQVIGEGNDNRGKVVVVIPTIVLSTESGELQNFDLKDVRSVKLLEEGTRTDIKNFSNAVASARRRDAKTISITSDGEGQREMVVSYTIAAPIWKTTYRVLLDQSSQPFFQGWAVVDNVSEEDWENVSLSLVSGTPVSFIQNIQKPLYRYRPVIAIPHDLKLEPQVYEDDLTGVPGGVAGGVGSGVGGGELALSSRTYRNDSDNKSSKETVSVQQQIYSANLSTMTTTPIPLLTMEAGISSAIIAGDSGIETAASGSELGELFEYKVERPVTIRKDRSALIPILQSKMDGERISIYNESVRRDRPMYGMRLKNTSNLVLESGAIAVIDGDAYAGEALIERFKPNEQRFISFGLDQGTLVSSKQTNDRLPVFMVRTVKGVFEAHYNISRKQTYTLINQTDKPRVVYIEHPINHNMKLLEGTVQPVSKSSRFYRFRVQLEPRQTLEFPVTETQPNMDGYQLAAIGAQHIDLFLTNKYIDADLKNELEKLISLKSKINKLTSIIEAFDNESEEITEDQTRLRNNIETLKNNAQAKQLVLRYIAKADQQESRLEQIIKGKAAAQLELTKFSEGLDLAIRTLALIRTF